MQMGPGLGSRLPKSLLASATSYVMHDPDLPPPDMIQHVTTDVQEPPPMVVNAASLLLHLSLLFSMSWMGGWEDELPGLRGKDKRN